MYLRLERQRGNKQEIRKYLHEIKLLACLYKTLFSYKGLLDQSFSLYFFLL